MASGTTTGLALLPSALWSGPILYFLALIVLLILGFGNGNSLPRSPPQSCSQLRRGFMMISPTLCRVIMAGTTWRALQTLLLLARAIGSAWTSRRFIAAAKCRGGCDLDRVTQQALRTRRGRSWRALAGMGWSKFQKGSDETSTISNGELMPAESWRAFGLAGAGAALLFYLLEYAPAPLSFRLEVNHPIYALAFFLGGEFLCRAQRLLFIRVRRKSDHVWAAALRDRRLAVIGAAIFLGPMEWHAMRQPFMQRLHEEIAEFQPIARVRKVPHQFWFLVRRSFLSASGFCRACRYRLTTRETDGPSDDGMSDLGRNHSQSHPVSLGRNRPGPVRPLSPPCFSPARPGGAPPNAALPLPLVAGVLHLLSLGAAAGWNLRHQSDNPAEVRAESD